jgi:hypothetical protein
MTAVLCAVYNVKFSVLQRFSVELFTPVKLENGVMWSVFTGYCVDIIIDVDIFKAVFRILDSAIL